MNLDDFLNGNNGIDTNADTLPQVYGLDDDAVVSKTKRLVKGAFECDKDHEVIELIRAEADSDTEALVLTHLLGKYMMEVIMKQSSDALQALAVSLAMGVTMATEKLELSDAQAEGLLDIMSDAIESAGDSLRDE